jgi:FAD:protein FMN transferase
VSWSWTTSARRFATCSPVATSSASRRTATSRSRRPDDRPVGARQGLVVDEAVALADELGWRNYAVNASGDLRLRGGALPADEWRVGIQHPALRGNVAAVVVGNELAVATSGEYAHVFDPHTRRPPDGVVSVTVAGADLATADAYATAAFAMGSNGASWTARLKRGYTALTILPGDRMS